jgi:hypothetical protein
LNALDARPRFGAVFDVLGRRAIVIAIHLVSGRRDLDMLLGCLCSRG